MKRTSFPLPDRRLLLIILIAILSRLFVFTIVPQHIANPWDSVDYGRYAQLMIHEHRIQDFFNPVRPPVYPIIIAISFLLTGVKQTDAVYSVLNDFGGSPVALLQTILGILSVVTLFSMLKVIVHRYIAFIFALLFAIHPLIILWDRYILTESLSISFAILFLYVSLLFIERPSVQRSILLVTIGLLSVWLRSIYLVFVPLVLGIYICKTRDLKSIAVSYFLGVLFFLPLVGHILINNQFYGVPTFQVMSTINMYGRLLVHPYTIPQISNNRVASWMQTNFVPNTYSNPFPILESMNPEVYHDKELITNLQEYNRTAIRQNSIPFIRDLLMDIPKMYEVNGSLIFPTSPSWYRLFQQLFVFITLIFSIVLVGLPLCIYLFIKERTLLVAFTVFCGLGAFYFLLTSVIFGYVDSSRYALGAVPFLFVYVPGIVEICLRRSDIHRKKHGGSH